LIRKYPELKPAFEEDVFKFLPLNEKEERAYEINSDVSKASQLLDDRKDMEVYEDLVMFIGLGKPISSDEWDKIKERFDKEI
jgi:hypothetical protein